MTEGLYAGDSIVGITGQWILGKTETRKRQSCTLAALITCILLQCLLARRRHLFRVFPAGHMGSIPRPFLKWVILAFCTETAPTRKTRKCLRLLDGGGPDFMPDKSKHLRYTAVQPCWGDLNGLSETGFAANAEVTRRKQKRQVGAGWRGVPPSPVA